MIRRKLVFRIIEITMISVGLLGCTNQNSKKAVNNTTASVLSSAEINKTEQAPQAPSITSSPEVGKTQAEQQTEQAAGKNNAANKKIVKEAFYGKWKIEKVLAYGPVGTYSDDEIKAILGRMLSFSNESASCFGDKVEYLNDTAENPVYKESVITKNEFEANNRITIDKLGVEGDSVTEIEAADAKGNGCTFLIKDSYTLILFGGGVYFELKRI